jgi:hypothetical protein
MQSFLLYQLMTAEIVSECVVGSQQPFLVCATNPQLGRCSTRSNKGAENILKAAALVILDSSAQQLKRSFAQTESKTDAASLFGGINLSRRGGGHSDSVGRIKGYCNHQRRQGKGLGGFSIGALPSARILICAGTGA